MATAASFGPGPEARSALARPGPRAPTLLAVGALAGMLAVMGLLVRTPPSALPTRTVHGAASAGVPRGLEPLEEARLVGVPPEMAADALAAGVDDVTLVAVRPGTGGPDHYTLWRLTFADGTLVPGPVVPEIASLLPAAGRDRRAMLNPGGSLFVLDGFRGSRPEWIGRSVDAYGFGPGTLLVHAGVRLVRGEPGVRSVVSVTRLRPSGARGWTVSDRLRVGLPGLAADRLFVLAGGVFVAGERDEGLVTLRIDGRGNVLHLAELDGYRLIDVGPGPSLLVTRAGEGAGAPLVARLGRGEHRRPAPLWPGFRLGSASAWSPEGTVLAAVGHPAGRTGHLGLWALPLDGTPAVLLRGAPPFDQPVMSSVPSGGGAVVWTDGRAVYLRRLARAAVTRRMPMPEGFGQLASPLAAR